MFNSTNSSTDIPPSPLRAIFAIIELTHSSSQEQISITSILGRINTNPTNKQTMIMESSPVLFCCENAIPILG